MALMVGLCPQQLGCAVRVRLESNPVGAVVSVNGEPVGVTPLEYAVPFSPIFLSPGEVRLALPQHRPVELGFRGQARLYRRGLYALFHPLRALGLRPPPVTKVLLIESHGPVGTWSAE